jgi:hypothetical protein
MMEHGEDMNEYEGFSEADLLADIATLRAFLGFEATPEACAEALAVALPHINETLQAAEELLAELIEAHRLLFAEEAEGF